MNKKSQYKNEQEMTRQNLAIAYNMPGYKAVSYIDEYPGRPHARIVTLRRIQKKQNVLNVRKVTKSFMTEKHA